MTLLQVPDVLLTLASDSISYSDSVLNALNQIYLNTCPEPHTIKGLNISSESLAVSQKNYFIAIIGAGIGLISAVAAILSAKFSKQTADNVERVDFEIQNKLLKDLIRHLFRNQVCTIAFAAKTKENPNQYPSDEHILKLKVLADDIHLEKYNSNPVHYDKMHGLSLLLRNYNSEIEITHKHLIDPNTTLATKNNDIATLLFKPIFLINRIWGTMAIITKTENTDLKEAEKENQKNAIEIILESHITNLLENYYIDNIPDTWEHKEIINNFKANIRVDKINELINGITFDTKTLRETYESLITEINKRISNLAKEGKEKEAEKREKALEKLKGIILEETNATDISNITWNSDLILQVLITDSIIEYNKIRMINYPLKKIEIATTEEELEAFYIIKSILRTNIPAEDIIFRDTKSYFNILTTKSAKLICRLYLNYPTTKQISFINEDRKETKYDIKSIDDIYSFSELIITAANNAINQ